MLIRTGQAMLEVGSLDSSIVRIRSIASELDAVVANEWMTGGRGHVRRASLELRVPAASFEEAIERLRPVGRMESLRVAAEEVGEEYVDVVARVANARRLEARLVDLLRTRTGKLADVLSVERELARVREEIERHEGRARYLRSRVAISTLNVSMREPRPILAAEPGENPFVVATRHAWRNFVGFVAGAIAASGFLIPLGGIALAGWWIFRRARPDNRAEEAK